ncbi:MAG TPA: site-specific integrase [Cyclobacteriaceae bacterium]|nr:site-specific integrase [Cyclobacteriaceae bacterium]
MVTNVLAVRFFVKRDKESNGIAPVYVRISVDGRSVDVSVKRRVMTSNWDNARECVLGTRQEAKQFNSCLETIRTDLTNIYTDLRNQRKTITAELIKNTYCGIARSEQTLLGLIDYHNNHLKSKLEWGTMKNYETTQKYIQRFLNEIIRRADIPLSQLTYSFLVDFELYLKRVKTNKHDSRPCGHNTILKHIERLRKMIGVALRNEWIDKDPFIKFQARFIRKERHFHSLEDLKAIEAKEFAVERLGYVRDLFVFSCYTGLAYNEVMTLKQENIRKGIDGDWWIMMTRKKTNLPVRVPLLQKAMVLIEKYKKYGFETLFPSMSNQKLNAYLKEIADVCGVVKHLTFHLARHTFATTVTLTNGVPIETVSKMLGHTSIRTTQIYAKVVERKVSEDMRLLKQKLEPIRKS